MDIDDGRRYPYDACTVHVVAVPCIPCNILFHCVSHVLAVHTRVVLDAVRGKATIHRRIEDAMALWCQLAVLLQRLNGSVSGHTSTAATSMRNWQQWYQSLTFVRIAMTAACDAVFVAAVVSKLAGTDIQLHVLPHHHRCGCTDGVKERGYLQKPPRRVPCIEPRVLRSVHEVRDEAVSNHGGERQQHFPRLVEPTSDQQQSAEGDEGVTAPTPHEA